MSTTNYLLAAIATALLAKTVNELVVGAEGDVSTYILFIVGGIAVALIIVSLTSLLLGLGI